MSEVPTPPPALLVGPLDDTGGEIGRRDDLEHLEVLRAGDLTVLDAGRLQDGVALADRSLALALVLERGPAVHDVDELERAVVHVPLLHLVLHFLAVVADEVGDEVALGAVLDAEIAVLEDLAQAGVHLASVARSWLKSQSLTLAMKFLPCRSERKYSSRLCRLVENPIRIRTASGAGGLKDSRRMCRPAVDRDHGPRDVRGPVRREEGHEIGALLGRADGRLLWGSARASVSASPSLSLAVARSIVSMRSVLIRPGLQATMRILSTRLVPPMPRVKAINEALPALPAM